MKVSQIEWSLLVSHIPDVFKRAYSTFSAPEYLARFEAQCRFSGIANGNCGPTVYTPDSVYPDSTISAGQPVEVRHMLRPLIISSGAFKAEPYSQEETGAIVAALEIRFGYYENLYNQLQNYSFEDGQALKWKEQFLDGLENVLCGYVNLICQVNFEPLAEKNSSNEMRVNDFLTKNEDTVTSIFSSQGGAPAFLARTKGLPETSVAAIRIFNTLTSLDLDQGPSFQR